MGPNWQSFYQTTGSASGALIGLLFIVATLTNGTLSHGANIGLKLFSTPTVVHLAVVLLASTLSLMPDLSTQTVDALLLALAVGSFVYATTIAFGVARLDNPTHWSDVWCYGALPCVVYLALIFAGAASLRDAPFAPHAVATTLLCLLAVALRNAWDLVTWLAPRRTTP